MSSDKYTQHDGYDKYCNTDENGNTKNRGKAEYDSDGSMTRLDNYSPSKEKPGYHHHEWVNKKDDGSYEYGYGLHKDH